MPTPMLWRLLLAICLVPAIGQAQHSVACPVCVSMGDPFQLPHPHALRIAVATRAAMDRGVLPEPRAGESVALKAALLRVANHQLSNRPANRAAAVDLDILLVDEPVLYRVELRGIVARVFPLHGERHRPAQVRLVATRPVIESLARGQLTIPEGIHHGLIELEGAAAVLSERCRD